MYEYNSNRIQFVFFMKHYKINLDLPRKLIIWISKTQKRCLKISYKIDRFQANMQFHKPLDYWSLDLRELEYKRDAMQKEKSLKNPLNMKKSKRQIINSVGINAIPTEKAAEQKSNSILMTLCCVIEIEIWW